MITKCNALVFDRLKNACAFVFACAVAILLLLPQIAIAGEPWGMADYKDYTYYGDGYGNGDPITYRARHGWGGHDCYPEAWMWIKPMNRGVGQGAIMSQSGLTIVGDGYKHVEWGPRVTNMSAQSKGVAVESHLYLYRQRSRTVSYAWGYGIVRDPLLNYHDINTTENGVISC